MDTLAALKLQAEWGADEALDPAPVNRLEAFAAPEPAAPSPPARPPSRAWGGRAAARAEEAAAAAGNVEALREALAAFEGCALRDTASHLVFAAGDGQGGLMGIGDAPGPDEDRTGTPFAGAAGRMLDDMLGSIGLARAAIRLTVLVPWRPPGGRPPTEAEVTQCLPFLHRHVALVRPRRLLLLGTLVSRTLLAGTPADRRRQRGGWASVAIPGLPSPIAALSCASPAALLANQAGRRDAWAALRLLRRALDDDVSQS